MSDQPLYTFQQANLISTHKLLNGFTIVVIVFKIINVQNNSEKVTNQRKQVPTQSLKYITDASKVIGPGGLRYWR